MIINTSWQTVEENLKKRGTKSKFFSVFKNKKRIRN